jgi:16S rRNA (uracil1498-N3)-methyltransferase
MHRFFVPPELLANLAPARGATTSLSEEPLGNVVALAGARYELPQLFVLPKDLAHQVRDVIRLKVGDQLLLLDNSGDEILAKVVKTSKAEVEVQLIERLPGKSEPAVRIILCQGLLKSARFEWIFEKGTELGVSVFSPIICHRSTAGLEDARPNKIQRWQRIIQEAAEQSGRSHLPELLPIRPLTHALNDIPSNALAIMPWEEEHILTLHDVLSTSIRPTGNVGATLAVARSSQTPTPHPPTTVVLFIGPEGGLTTEEVALAQRNGVRVVTLGARILRAETATLATIANVMYEMEQ